jgi:hypothetical protein
MKTQLSSAKRERRIEPGSIFTIKWEWFGCKGKNGLFGQGPFRSEKRKSFSTKKGHGE